MINKAALITGGDSGIGRAVAVAFAKEGADLSLVYLNEHPRCQVNQTACGEFGSPLFAFAGRFA